MPIELARGDRVIPLLERGAGATEYEKRYAKVRKIMGVSGEWDTGEERDWLARRAKLMRAKGFSTIKEQLIEFAIEIDPANEGKFTATKKRTGKSDEELAHSKNITTKRRAIFAINSRKWNHGKKEEKMSALLDGLIQFKAVDLGVERPDYRAQDEMFELSKGLKKIIRKRELKSSVLGSGMKKIGLSSIRAQLIELAQPIHDQGTGRFIPPQNEALNGTNADMVYNGGKRLAKMEKESVLKKVLRMRRK